MDKKENLRYDTPIQCGGYAVIFERGEVKWRFLFSEVYIPKKISFTHVTFRFRNSRHRMF